MAVPIYDFEIFSKKELLERAKVFADNLEVDLNTALQILILSELKQLNEFTEQNGKFLYEILEK